MTIPRTVPTTRDADVPVHATDAPGDYERAVTDLNSAVRLKAWTRVPALEAEVKRLRPQRVELAQDAYYYGTAADFAPAHNGGSA